MMAGLVYGILMFLFFFAGIQIGRRIGTREYTNFLIHELRSGTIKKVSEAIDKACKGEKAEIQLETLEEFMERVLKEEKDVAS